MVVTIIIIVFYWFMIDIMLSLATSIGNNEVVTTESTFQIPMIASNLEQNYPKFFSKLWTIKDIFCRMNKSLREMHEISLEYSTISSDSSPNPSPNKKQRTKKFN